ncbi:MAG: hypothetical protein RLZZ242_1222 [Bacteroidota bacterium]|jgi:hypothetical protein
MKVLIAIAAMSFTLATGAQVIIERADNNKHVIIELDSITYNDASEALSLAGRKGWRSLRFMADHSVEQLNSEQRAALMTKRMTLHLDLNEKQEKEVARINESHHQQMQELRKKEEGFEKQSALLDEQIKHLRSLKAVLDPNQYEKFKTMHESMRKAHHRSEGAANRNTAVRMLKWKEDHEDAPAIEHHQMRIKEVRKHLGDHREDGPAHRKRNIAFISAGEQPLMIIDGKEAEKDATMNDIDPKQIKSVEVLKGDEALKRFGEKGKNGVILITTKK